MYLHTSVANRCIRGGQMGRDHQYQFALTSAKQSSFWIAVSTLRSVSAFDFLFFLRFIKLLHLKFFSLVCEHLVTSMCVNISCFNNVIHLQSAFTLYTCLTCVHQILARSCLFCISGQNCRNSVTWFNPVMFSSRVFFWSVVYSPDALPAQCST